MSGFIGQSSESGSSSGIITAVNAVALTTTSVAGLPIGALAPSYCAYFSLQSSTGVSLSPGNVIASSSSSYVWMRVAPSSQERALTQATWYVDPQNVTGLASDENSGIDATHPVLTWNGGVVARYGTATPRLWQSTVITFLSSHTNDSDPVVFSPRLNLDSTVDAGVVIIQGVLGASQQIGTGTITVTEAKGNTNLLTITLPSGGTYSPGLFISNAARTSAAWTKSNVSGNTWTVTQPIIPIKPAYAGGGLTPHADNTWATGDTVTIYDLIAVNLVEYAPIPEAILPSLDDFAFLYHVKIYNPDVTLNIETFTPGQLMDFIECVSNRVVVYPTGINVAASYYSNTFFRMGISGGEHSAPNLSCGPGIYGGALGIDPLALGFVRLAGGTLDLGVVIGQAFTGFAPPSLEAGQIGEIYLDTGAELVIIGNTRIDGTLAGVYGTVGIVRGPGLLCVLGNGRLSYATTAIATFVNSGGLQINNLTTAFSYSGTTPVVINGGITISPTNLDATAGSSGFGGTAFIFGGGTITNKSL